MRGVRIEAGVDLGADGDRLCGGRREQPERVGPGRVPGTVHRQGVVASPQQHERIGPAQAIGIRIVEIAAYHGPRGPREGPGKTAVGGEGVEIDPRVLGQMEGELIGLTRDGERPVDGAVEGQARLVVGHPVQGEAVADGDGLIRRPLDDEGVITGRRQTEDVDVAEIIAPTDLAEPGQLLNAMQ